MSDEKRLPATTFTGWDPTPEERARGHSGPVNDGRCKTCDRPVASESDWLHSDDCRDVDCVHGRDKCWGPNTSCEANRIDWRARALESKSLLGESQEGHARTVAELWDAKAECNRLWAFVDDVAGWRFTPSATLAMAVERIRVLRFRAMELQRGESET